MNKQFCVNVHQKLPSNSIRIHCYEENKILLTCTELPSRSSGAESEALGSADVSKDHWTQLCSVAIRDLSPSPPVVSRCVCAG